MNLPTLTDLAPCTLASTAGNLDLPHALLGQPLVLFFYPKDNTPGCTQEAQEFAALHADFAQRGAKIVGVSRDSLKSHDNAKKRLGLPFDLISDSDEILCRHFDVIKLKKLYGKEYLGIDRSTFLFDAQGHCVQAWRAVKVPGHAQAVLMALTGC